MKKPYYNQLEREIIKRRDTLWSDTVYFWFAKHRFCKIFTKQIKRIFE